MTNLDLPEGHREHEATATKALNVVKSEAAAVRQTATEHPSSTMLLLSALSGSRASSSATVSVTAKRKRITSRLSDASGRKPTEPIPPVP